MIDPDRLRGLLEPADPVLSVYVRFDPDQRDLRGPEADLRRLTGEARAQLAEHGLDDVQRQALLAPLEELARANLADHRDPGVAIFARADGVDVVQLPEALPEMVVVGRHAHLKPLLPALERYRRFHILALSSARARLVTATPYSWEERRLEALPTAQQAELDSLPAGDPITQAAERMRLITEDPNHVVHALRAALGPDAGPIVLVAEPQVAGHFIKAGGLPELLADRVAVNPFALADEEILNRALAVIEPVLRAEADAVLDQVQARLGAAERNVAIRLEEILAAGVEGRVDAILVAGDEILWGRYTPGHVLTASGHRARGDEDLINMAAVQAMRTGARAFARPRAELPRQVPAAATLRF